MIDIACPQALDTPVLRENIAQIRQTSDAILNTLDDPVGIDQFRDVLDKSLLPVCAVSAYIERCCLQFENLLPQLYTERMLTADSPPSTLPALTSLLQAELDELISSKCPVGEKALEAAEQSALRRFRNRRLVGIMWRDLIFNPPLEITLRELSLLAEACISKAEQWTHNALQKQFGSPHDPAGKAQRMIIVGMGKLGGYELNVSSDVDLIFVWPSAGETRLTQTGQRVIDNTGFFRRAAQRIIRLLQTVTHEGFVYRVDTRLRPFGESGALVSNFDALEHYYLTQARDWERYAMIKARALTGDPEDIDALTQLLTPFVYRRYLDYNAFESLRQLKRKIELSVARKGMQDNLKLGTGGIREIEFVGQAFQLVRGGRDARLRIRSILDVLDLIGEMQLLLPSEVNGLKSAYEFLRRAENAIQIMRDEQRHSLPADEQDRLRLTTMMRVANWQSFLDSLQVHREHVSRAFRQVFEHDDAGGGSAKNAQANEHAGLPGRQPQDARVQQMQTIWLQLAELADNEQRTQLLTEAGFATDDTLLSLVDSLNGGSFFQRLTADSQQRVEQIVPMIMAAALDSDVPTDTLTRGLSLVRAVAGRSGYLQVLYDQPAALTRLIRLFASSRWLAGFVVRQPMVIDELVSTHIPEAYPGAEALRAETESLVDRLRESELEEQMNSLRHFRQSREMRIACARLDGRLSLMKVSDQLSWLAESLITGVVSLVEHHLIQRHGRPHCLDPDTGRRRPTRLAIVAYGKLGGLELGFGSDLDLVFLHDSRGEQQTTDGQKSIDNSLFYSRLTQKFVHFMNTLTPAGKLYEIDLRLRPNGNAGVMVTGLEAYASYQHNEAWTWEHQALMRARMVYGPQAMHQQFDAIRQSVLAQPRSAEEVRKAVAGMRKRMRDALGNKDPEQMHLKQDAGGVADIEFITQYLVLAHAADYPQLLQDTDNVRVLERAAALELIATDDADTLIKHYLKLREHLHQAALQESSPVLKFNAELISLRDEVLAIRRRILPDE